MTDAAEKKNKNRATDSNCGDKAGVVKGDFYVPVRTGARPTHRLTRGPAGRCGRYQRPPEAVKTAGMRTEVAAEVYSLRVSEGFQTEFTIMGSLVFFLFVFYTVSTI